MYPSGIVLRRPAKHSRRCRQLRAKLSEYIKRYQRHQERWFCGDPFLTFEAIRHYRFRIAVLTRLLDDGRVDVDQVHDNFVQYDLLSPADEGSFFTAWVIINDYLKSGGRHIIGGTGLPDVP